MTKPNFDVHHEETTVVEDDLQEPRQYIVLLHNDDYTSMEFVVFILQRVFHKNVEDATRIMLAVHQEGIGVCGIYTHEIAETKVKQVRILSREAGFPLRCTLEESV